MVSASQMASTSVLGCYPKASTIPSRDSEALKGVIPPQVAISSVVSARSAGRHILALCADPRRHTRATPHSRLRTTRAGACPPCTCSDVRSRPVHSRRAHLC